MKNSFLDLADMYYEEAINNFENKKYHISGINSVEAIERYLKYLLNDIYRYDGMEMRSHSLNALCRVLLKYNDSFKLIQDNFFRLNSIYFDARYPGNTFYELQEEDAAIAIDTLKKTKNLSEQILNEHNNNI